MGIQYYRTKGILIEYLACEVSCLSKGFLPKPKAYKISDFLQKFPESLLASDLPLVNCLWKPEFKMFKTVLL